MYAYVYVYALFSPHILSPKSASITVVYALKHLEILWIGRKKIPPPKESKEALGMLREIGATWGETVPWLQEWTYMVHVDIDIHPLKLTANAPEIRPGPKRKLIRLPTIHFQGQAVSFRGCMIKGILSTLLTFPLEEIITYTYS